MVPDPLHPAVVHFPLVLMFLVPIFAVIAMVRIQRGARAWRAWSVPLALAAALAVSSFVAVRSGQAGEERVERVVPESALHEHEEAAELFLVLGGVLLGVACFGLLRGNIGTAARLLTVAGSLAVTVVGFQVGAAGGELVYGHNAGSAYAAGATAPADIDD